MDELRRIAQKREEAYTWYKSHGSKGYAAIVDLEAAIFPDGALSQKHKALIAVAISVMSDCRSGMQCYIERAAEYGATLEEVIETIDVAIKMGGGVAFVSCRFAMDVMRETFEAGGQIE
jgi:alkylhydroperoxidase/carboxymuconolactone decarboxylase family protein YurZ